jgi:hypothetical protein
LLNAKSGGEDDSDVNAETEKRAELKVGTEVAGTTSCPPRDSDLGRSRGDGSCEMARARE